MKRFSFRSLLPYNAILILLIFCAFCFSLTYGQKPSWPEKLVVAQDGSGDFTTIQAAVNAVRDLSQVEVKIYIKKGVYREKLRIPSWKTHITLIGENRDSTIITWNDFSGKPFECDPFGKGKHTTYTSYTVLVEGQDFQAQNLTIENTAGRVGQAVALHVEADRVVIRNCRLLGNQDTLYAATGGSRQYYENCYIEGTTDFIFGEAVAYFEKCTIHSLSDSYITAAATPKGQSCGFVFDQCHLEASSGVRKVFLGRPWRPNAMTVFINCLLDRHILPAGWDNWRNVDNEKTVFYAEFQNKGDGSAFDQRVPWSKQLTDAEISRFSLSRIFQGWNPF